jgi:hypothetical protein
MMSRAAMIMPPLCYLREAQENFFSCEAAAVDDEV